MLANKVARAVYMHDAAQRCEPCDSYAGSNCYKGQLEPYSSCIAFEGIERKNAQTK